jgi:2-dehydro-3-deoxyphosphooctonate aldolase (KDO 8-P synthase)
VSSQKPDSKESLLLIAGPCAVEDEGICFEIAEAVSATCSRLHIEYIFKASFKKANRTSLFSYTGIGMDEALNIIKKVGKRFHIATLTDVHETTDCPVAANYVDWLQIPAFLSRQTELLIAAGETGKGVNIKKGQFLSPEAMQFAVEKVESTGNKEIMLTERGTTFGYDSLVVDFTSVPRMKRLGHKVIVDCTHSVQRPNQGSVTGGDAEMIETLARAAVAVGADGLFIEVHPDPSTAKSDSASMLKLDRLENILEVVTAIAAGAKGAPVVASTNKP